MLAYDKLQLAVESLEMIGRVMKTLHYLQISAPKSAPIYCTCRQTLQSRQHLLISSIPIMHLHLLEHPLGFIQVFQSLFFLSYVGV